MWKSIPSVRDRLSCRSPILFTRLLILTIVNIHDRSITVWWKWGRNTIATTDFYINTNTNVNTTDLSKIMLLWNFIWILLRIISFGDKLFQLHYFVFICQLQEKKSKYVYKSLLSVVSLLTLVLVREVEGCSEALWMTMETSRTCWKTFIKSFVYHFKTWSWHNPLFL